MRKIVALLVLAGLVAGAYVVVVEKGWHVAGERIAGELEDKHRK